MLICSLAKPDLNSKWPSVLFVSLSLPPIDLESIYFPCKHTWTPLLLSVYQGEQKTLFTQDPRWEMEKMPPEVGWPHHQVMTCSRHIHHLRVWNWSVNWKGSSGDSVVKNSPANVGDERREFNSWVGKIPGEGNGDPLQYSCLENPMRRGTWWATVHEVAKRVVKL